MRFKQNRTIVITPTRGRPDNFARMVKFCQEMSASGVDVYAGVDEDDPKIWNYHQVRPQFGHVKIFVGPRKTLSAWTNELAMQAIENVGTDCVYLVSMGDDHVVRSSFWDIKMQSILKMLPGPGFVYGDDLMNGSGLCTCWMASAQAVDALGWMMLPRLKHMYVDNAIMELGEAANRLTYISNLTIEHLHPAIKKSELDSTYLEAEDNYVPDLEQFRMWRSSPDFVRDVEKLKSISWSK